MKILKNLEIKPPSSTLLLKRRFCSQHYCEGLASGWATANAVGIDGYGLVTIRKGYNNIVPYIGRYLAVYVAFSCLPHLHEKTIKAFLVTTQSALVYAWVSYGARINGDYVVNVESSC